MRDGRVVLKYQPKAEAADESGPVARLDTGASSADEFAYEEARREFQEAEAALLRGELRLALGAYRQAAAVQPQSRFVMGRLLHLLSAAAATLAEADEMASATLAHWPEFTPALLAKAVAAAERGRHAEAAECYGRIATAAESAGAETDEACARAAAAAQHAAAGNTAACTAETRAGARAAARSPGGSCARSPNGWRARSAGTILLQLLRQRAADEEDPLVRAEVQAESGLILLERLGDRTRARHRFEQALRLHPDVPGAWEGLGRLQALEEDGNAAASLEKARRLYAGKGNRQGQARTEVALAGLDESGGHAEAALARLRRAADLDPEATDALRDAGGLRFVSGVTRGGDRGVSGRARPRPPAEGLRVLLRRLSAIELEGKGDPVAARPVAGRGAARAADGPRRARRPRGAARGAGARRRAGGVSAPGARAGGIRRRAAGAGRAPGEGPRTGEARASFAEVLGLLAAEGGPEGAEAAAELAGLAEASGDEAAISHWADVLEGLLQSNAADLPRAELAYRLALLRLRQGVEAAALGWCEPASNPTTPRARWRAGRGSAWSSWR